MEENEFVAEETPEENPDDKCICGHNRDKHTANQHCRDCKDCHKFQQEYDSA